MKTIKVAFEGLARLKDHILKSLKKYYNVIETNDADFLFFDYLNNEFLYYPENCIKIYASPENGVPDFNYCDYAISTARLEFGERYFRYPFSLSLIDPYLLLKRPAFDLSYAKRKFCNFFYSNKNKWPCVKIRKDFCLKLFNYKHIDCPGRSLNNMNKIDKPGINWTITKLNFLKQYKFTISFENEYDLGYVTEKISQPFVAGSIPIYLGAPDVNLDFNPEAFINVKSIDNFDNIIEFIKYLDNNDDEYLKMLNSSPFAKNFSLERFSKSFDNFLINIIENKKKYVSYLNKYCDVPSNPRENILIEIRDRLFTPLLDNSAKKAKRFLHSLEGREYSIRPIGTTLMKEKLNVIEAKINSFVNLETQLHSFINEYGINEFLVHKIKMILSTSDKINKTSFCKEKRLEILYKQLLFSLWPNDIKHYTKIKIEEKENYNKILLSNNTKATVISIGDYSKIKISKMNANLINMGYKVFQLDNSSDKIEKVNLLNNIDTQINNIDKDKMDFLELYKEYKLEECENLIVIYHEPENAIGFLNYMIENKINFISQINITIKDICNISKVEELIQTLHKLQNFYLPTHLHYNNESDHILFQNFIISDTLEILLANKKLGEFTKSLDSFPTALDNPSNSKLLDIHIGKFCEIL